MCSRLASMSSTMFYSSDEAVNTMETIDRLMTMIESL